MTTTNLDDIVKRLESATSRLEALAAAGGSASATNKSSPATGGGGGGGSSAASVAAYSEIFAALKTFADAGRAIGGVVKDQVEFVEKAFTAQLNLIELASQSKKPDAPYIPEVVKPLQTAIQKIVEIKDKNRPSPLFNHLSCIAEGIPALGWVLVEPTPAPFVGEMKDAAAFYSNRVIKEYKDKDKSHCDYVNLFSALLVELQTYVKKFHTTGLVWNPKGGDAKSFAGAVAISSPAVTAPTPNSSPATAAPSAPSAAGGGLMSALNSMNLTSGLRKVDKSEMTHKNPELRASSIVKASDTPAAPAAAAPAKSFAAAPKAPPKLALEGNKWVVENHVNNSAVVIDKAELRHVVYIYNCTGSTVQIKGKVNAVTIDNCKKTGIVVDNAVSTVDIVNCKSIQVQITGKVPTIVIDKTDGFQGYLSKDCLDVEILSAKSSEMNVLFEDPKKAPGTGDYIERPVSEQFKTTIVDGNLHTVCVEHKG